MRKYGKFVALVVVVVGVLIMLAFTGMDSSKTYYKTIAELGKMGDQAYGKKLRVGGDIETGSIHRVGHEVQFVLIQDKLRLKVAYTGDEPLPDTFKDGAQALADGRLEKDGIFRTRQIQAKCASKYEVKPGQLPINANSGKGTV